jgi:hypothetical protein
MSTEHATTQTGASTADQLSVRRLDVGTLRDQAQVLKLGDEILAIEENGQLLGYFVPVKSTTSPAAQRARARLEGAIAEARAVGVFDEAALSAAFDLKASA